MSRDWLGFRQPRNIESREQAVDNNEPWQDWQLDLLLEWSGDDEDLTVLAELLGRTREACRERCYQTRKGNRRTAARVPEPRSRTAQVTRTTTTTTTYYYDRWPEDERSEWYR